MARDYHPQPDSAARSPTSPGEVSDREQREEPSIVLQPRSIRRSPPGVVGFPSCTTRHPSAADAWSAARPRHRSQLARVFQGREPGRPIRSRGSQAHKWESGRKACGCAGFATWNQRDGVPAISALADPAWFDVNVHGNSPLNFGRARLCTRWVRTGRCWSIESLRLASRSFWV